MTREIQRTLNPHYLPCQIEPARRISDRLGLAALLGGLGELVELLLVDLHRHGQSWS